MKSQENKNQKRAYVRDRLAYVRRLISQLPFGLMFTTRELLPLVEKRGPLDCYLSAQVKSGNLERLARGVFRKRHRFNRSVSEEAVVALKRRVFAGRGLSTCVSRGTLALEKQAFQDELSLASSREPGFVSLASRCSFAIEQLVTANSVRSYSVRIVRAEMPAVGNRKAILGETQAGRLFRDIWLAGEKDSSPEDIEKAFYSLPLKERRILQSLRQYLPQWITDQLPSVGNEVLGVIVKKISLKKRGELDKYKVPGQRYFI